EVEEEDEDEDEDEEDEVNKEDKDDSCSEESSVQKQQKLAWTPCFFLRTDKEVYYYVGHKIVIEEGLDSYAGMIWPAALALCHYLDTHREQLSLVDKAVLEIGAGTGLLSVVAALLGAWVTATDLPEVLSKLRVNLSRNTRGYCRHTPQVAALSWGPDLERTYPTSVYRYDYVLAADVVYHHDFLDELLVTMKHFCKPGTTLIWANKVRYETDLKFTEDFQEAFHTSLLAEDGEMKIFMATSREEKQEGDAGLEIKDLLREKERAEGSLEDGECCSEKKEDEKLTIGDREQCEVYERDQPENIDSSCCTTSSDEDFTEDIKQTAVHSSFDKNIYHYAGREIVIYESIDSSGAVMRPAASALCSFLRKNRQRVNLQGKKVLELGAGTGLVTIVASLLGASVTATDLPQLLGNLRSNVVRNTRGRCRHTPKVEALSWRDDLEQTHPTSVYRYDYVLAADVVYRHDFLDELLATMKHFCQPGTTLIWANRVRFESDLTFTDNFKNTFNTSLLAEVGEMKIFMATCRE
ncbi:uncharacterized protein LOC121896821, partial [Thunnus maccoyii]|uniref:uncharacterized protein LOC121896821 n=1 Tax=Thunnus maccoyii TaxID=8240 RepID=UPI001C4C53E9